MTKRSLVWGRIHRRSLTSITRTILQGSILFFFYLVRVISVFLGSGADIRILLADSETDANETNLR